MLQILVFVLVAIIAFFFVGLVFLGIIGANIMRLVLWLKGLFSRKEQQKAQQQETGSQKPQNGKVFYDDEGEYVDFEEVK